MQDPSFNKEGSIGFNCVAKGCNKLIKGAKVVKCLPCRRDSKAAKLAVIVFVRSQLV